MKKTLVAAAAALAATGAFAQSNVTISGVASAGLQYRSTNTGNAGSEKWQIGNGTPNRLKFAGTEDLGGGLSASFALDNRFDLSTGVPDQAQATAGYAAGGTVAVATTGTTYRPFWHGQSTVSIKGNFGELKIGRDFSPYQISIPAIADPWSLSSLASVVFYAGQASDYVRGGEGRIQRAFFYNSPSFNGFSINFANGFDKGPGNRTTQGLDLRYNNGPLALALGGERNRFNDSILAFAAGYNFGSFKIGGDIYRTKGGSAADRAGSAFFASATFAGQVAANGTINGYSLNGVIPWGAAEVRVGYASWNGNGGVGTSNRDSKLGVGVWYSLSKRTRIYTDVASQTNKNALNASGNNNATTLFDLGLDHAF